MTKGEIYLIVFCFGGGIMLILGLIADKLEKIAKALRDRNYNGKCRRSTGGRQGK